MVSISIIEDQLQDQDKLKGYIEKYKQENKVFLVVKTFSTGTSFLEEYKSDADIIFMDIEMPGINGFDTAVELRKKDSKAVIVFITNLNKYAIKGYSVNAFDYISKPINYYSFSTMLKRAINKASYEKNFEAIINSQGSIIKTDVSSITYIEVMNHQLVYHTDGENIFCWGSLTSIKDNFLKKGFASANVSTLINLRRIYSLNGDAVTLNDEKHTKLYLSRSQRKVFALAFSEYISGEEH